MDVYSELGHGTTVKIYLPRVDQPAAVEPSAAGKKANRGTETILLVEDDEMVRALVRETLARDGYKVLEAADPMDAQRIASEFRSQIHLLITDVVMPKVSGRELAERLASQRPQMKVLYMSGYTDSAIVANGILEKEVAFLQKPFTPTVLAEKSARSHRNQRQDQPGR